MVRKIARLPRVEELTGLKKTKIYEMMNAGEFPRPVRLTDEATEKTDWA